MKSMHKAINSDMEKKDLYADTGAAGPFTGEPNLSAIATVSIEKYD